MMGDVNQPSLVASAVLTAGVGLAATFGDFLSLTVDMPVGFLLLLFALVILPTGDLLRLVSEYIDQARPDQENEIHYPPK